MNSPHLLARHLSSGPPICCYRTGGMPVTTVTTHSTIEADLLFGSGRLQVN